ncbi:hypothetical protein MIMGU_mgv1a017341mg [Erythranthe guttata]|uniref:Uncharacterized protein n=1 Tax=Erythranthe guttata TaxID=4155 RepID=A0A022Q3R0_ERYGU|nr:hypothetical protein MIMGU_mgv1a017341mg [Erythranthe guttata]
MVYTSEPDSSTTLTLGSSAKTASSASLFLLFFFFFFFLFLSMAFSRVASSPPLKASLPPLTLSYASDIPTLFSNEIFVKF